MSCAQLALYLGYMRIAAEWRKAYWRSLAGLR